MNNLKEIQELQIQYDNLHLAINSPNFEKIRHILLHLSCTIGKLSRFCEMKEHEIRENTTIPELAESIDAVTQEVIPDLLLHSLQLANCYGKDINELYTRRIEYLNQKANQKKRMLA